jgi:dienelactone hydrolase
MTVFNGQTVSGAGIPCNAQGDGVRVCFGTYSTTSDLRLKSFDGTPLEVYVILPPGTGTGPYPLVVQSHGWGGSAGGPSGDYDGPTADQWAKSGYAVLQLTARGFGMSCGKAAEQAEPPTDFLAGGKCASGYIRLDDDRYEVRDIQHAAGLLVDESLADPARIGATGDSYGGGVSLQLATLKDRIMNTDGSLSEWKSPGGTPISLAAAAPVIPWSDLVESLVPNGRTLDYSITSPTDDLSPIGVLKQSFVAGLFALGEASGNYSATDSSANLPAWYAATNAGEPYDSNPQDTALVDQIAHYHSAYYLLDGKYGTAKEPPAPLLIANGFDDDLFPVDEAVRYYNLERSLYPNDPIALLDGDFGHQRSQNKPADLALLASHIQAMFDHYVKGTAPQPPLGATASIETCPSSKPSGGPFSASSWTALHPGEVDYTAKSTQTVNSGAGDPTISKTIDPIAGGGACATVSSADQGSGVATYRLPTVTGNGYTLLGSATVIANLSVTGTFAYIAARLWDVNSATKTQTLVARGLYRIDSNKPDGLQVFQLHPGAWHFAAGHVPKLELLSQDVPYSRKSNGQFSISLSNLRLRLPVHDTPGAPGVPPIVKKPKPHVFPHPRACVAAPSARVRRSRSHGSRSGLILRGTAHENRCAKASSAKKRRKQHVVRVLISISASAGHGRCRFLRANGTLTSARSCSRPVQLRARGTRRWVLRISHSIPAGRYLIKVVAIDALRHRGPATKLKLRVR